MTVQRLFAHADHKQARYKVMQITLTLPTMLATLSVCDSAHVCGVILPLRRCDDAASR